MPIRIQRKRIINKRKSQYTAVDPAQNGAYTARLDRQTGLLALTGLRNQVALRQGGVLAAKWENEETLLIVVREEPEDEPVVLHAFKSRTQSTWETEDLPAARAHISPDSDYIALELALPNNFVAVLAAGKVGRDYAVRTNLGAPAESVEWSEQEGEDDKSGSCMGQAAGPTLTVQTAQHTLRWIPNRQQFKKTARN